MLRKLPVRLSLQWLDSWRRYRLQQTLRCENKLLGVAEVRNRGRPAQYCWSYVDLVAKGTEEGLLQVLSKNDRAPR